MKKSMKFISLLLAMVFLIAGTVMIVSAEGEEGGGETPIDTPVDPDPGPVDPDPGPVDPDPGPVDPDPGPVDPDPGPVDPDPIIDGGGTGTGTGDGEYTGGDNTGGSSYTPVYTDDPVFFGDASQYDYNTGSGDAAAGSVTQQTQQYRTSGMSDSEVAPNQWSEITLDENTTAANSAGASFASIKNNTAAEDDSQWILFLGYILIALAVLGVLYFIVATVAARSANKKMMSMQAERYYAPTPHTSHFAEDAPRRRVSAKADTGELYVPRRTR